MELNREKAGLSQGQVPFCPGEGSHLSQGRFLFVPATILPKMFMFIVFSFPRNRCNVANWRSHRETVQFWGSEWPPTVESSIAVEDAVENRGPYRVFVSHLF